MVCTENSYFRNILVTAKVYNDKVMAEQAMSELSIMFDRRVCEKVISEREIEA